MINQTNISERVPKIMYPLSLVGSFIQKLSFVPRNLGKTPRRSPDTMDLGAINPEGIRQETPKPKIFILMNRRRANDQNPIKNVRAVARSRTSFDFHGNLLGGNLGFGDDLSGPSPTVFFLPPKRVRNL